MFPSIPSNGYSSSSFFIDYAGEHSKPCVYRLVLDALKDGQHFSDFSGMVEIGPGPDPLPRCLAEFYFPNLESRILTEADWFCVCGAYEKLAREGDILPEYTKVLPRPPEGLEVACWFAARWRAVTCSGSIISGIGDLCSANSDHARP